MKNIKGITLIALVITIIVLIILAGVAINLTLGQNGLLNRTKEAREKYEIASAKEYIELKIDECIIEKGGDASLQDIIDYLAEDSSVTYYVALEEVGLVAGEVDIGSPKEIYVVYNRYQFKVDESKKVEFISIVDVDLEGKVSIEAQVKEHLGKNADGKYEASVLLKATGDAEISKLEIQNPDGTSLTLEPDGLTTVGKDITIEFDKIYKVILTTANGHKYTKKIIEKSEETIMNAEQLASFRDRVNSGLTYEGKTVKLGADIDLGTVCGANVGGKEVSWEPIGYYNSSDDYCYFNGTFDGNYHKIENLYYNSNKHQSVGMFYSVNLNGTVKKIILENVYINNMFSTATQRTGGITGENYGKIEMCSINTGNIQGNSTGTSQSIKIYEGGIVGVNVNENAIVDKCYNNATIIAKNVTNVYGREIHIGGILGNNSIGKIYDCYNAGSINANSWHVSVGGICGRQYKSNSEVKNCYNRGKLVRFR